MIVGVDPGTTVGIAILSVNREVLCIFSKKNMKINEVASFIQRFGKAILIATDKSNPPEAVRKVASILGAKLFCPDKDLSIEEKEALTRGFRVKNDHERDALAAAFYAYDSWIKKIVAAVDKELEEQKKKIIEEAVSLVVQGKAPNAAEAVRRVLLPKQESKEEKIRIIVQKVREDKRDNIMLKREVKILRKALDRLREENRALRSRLEKMEEERKRIIVRNVIDPALLEYVRELERRISSMENDILLLSKIIESQNSIKISQKEFLDVLKKYNIKINELLVPNNWSKEDLRGLRYSKLVKSNKSDNIAKKIKKIIEEERAKWL